MKLRKDRTRSDRAVSEVLGGVMLISVVVIAVAIIGVVLTSQGTPQKIPALDAIISNNDQAIHIFHDGGDVIGAGEIAIMVDHVDRTSLFTKAGLPWTTWTAGESLDYTSTGPQPRLIQIIFKGPSSQNVLVSADFSAGMPTQVPTAIPPSGPPPIVSGMAPSGGSSGSMVAATIAGSNFQVGASPMLVQGTTVISGSNVFVAAQNQITCSFSVPGTAGGSWNVVVTNPDGQSGSLGNGFSINAPGHAPTVTRLTPTTAPGGSTITVRNLTGTYFADGASVRLSRTGSADIFAQNVNVLDTTNITCTLVLPAGTPTGSWDVTVRNTDGQSGSLTNGFTVLNQDPAVTAIAPNSGNTGYIVTILNLAGSGFLPGAQVTLNSSAAPDIAATSVVVVSASQITCTFDLTGAPLGAWNIVVTNTDGKTGMLVNGFTVTAFAPSVTRISPITGNSGATYSPVTVSGAGFIGGATVSLNRTASTPINATSVNVGSANTIACTISLPSGAATGMWNIIVTNPDGQTGMLPNGFTIAGPAVPPAPVVTAILPGTTLQTTPVAVSVAGSGFNTSANLTLKQTGIPDIIATGVTIVSPNLITGNFNLAAAAPGPWDVVVTNTDGQSGTLTSGLLVKNPAPTVTAIAPISGVKGWPVAITSLSGSNFRSGAVVKLVNASAGPDITATGVTVVSPNVITCSFDLTGATAAKRTVTVTNPFSDTGSLANAFTVTSTAPTLTARNPTTANRGWPITIISLTGTGFQPGADVRLRLAGNPDIVAAGENVISATSIAGGTFNLQGVNAGTWNYVVINTDGQASTTQTMVISSSAPTYTSIAPATAARGTTVSITNLAGNLFQPGATVTLRNATTVISTATGVNVASPTQITCQFSIPAAAKTGANSYYVTITNTDAKTVSSGNIFSIT